MLYGVIVSFQSAAVIAALALVVLLLMVGGFVLFVIRIKFVASTTNVGDTVIGHPINLSPTL